MSIPLDCAAGYTAALHDVGEALKLAAHASRHGIVCDFEQLLRSELDLRWKLRIERGELPPCYAPHMVMALTEAAAAFAFAEPATRETF